MLDYIRLGRRLKWPLLSLATTSFLPLSTTIYCSVVAKSIDEELVKAYVKPKTGALQETFPPVSFTSVEQNLWRLIRLLNETFLISLRRPRSARCP